MQPFTKFKKIERGVFRATFKFQKLANVQTVGTFFKLFK